MGTAINLVSSNLLTIKQLQCFLAVAHELNFRKTANQLRMTQPPLTRQIKSLEHILGQQLFNRSTHEVHLTEAGHALADKVEHILRELHSLKNYLPQRSDNLRIGLTSILNFEYIPPIYDQLKKLITPRENQSFLSDFGSVAAMPGKKHTRYRSNR